MWAFHLLSEWVNVCSFALARNWTADSLFGNLFALKSIRPVAWEDENSFPQALILAKAGCPGLPNAFPMNSSICTFYLAEIETANTQLLSGLIQGSPTALCEGKWCIWKTIHTAHWGARECCHLALALHVPSSQRRVSLSDITARPHALIN